MLRQSKLFMQVIGEEVVCVCVGILGGYPLLEILCDKSLSEMFAGPAYMKMPFVAHHSPVCGQQPTEFRAHGHKKITGPRVDR